MIYTINTSIAIRVDANNDMGIGHVMRCIAVGEQLKKQGCEIVFLCNEIPDSLIHKICSRGFAFKHLPFSEFDISNVMHCIQDINAQYLVIDGYHLSDQYIYEARKMGIITIRFDDIRQDESSSAHIIINASSTADYKLYRKWALDAKLLLGPQYFAFREEIIDNTPSVKKRHPKKANSIFINFGGSDPLDLTYPVAISLSRVFPDATVNVITGAAFRNPDCFKNILQRNIKHFHDINNISKFMACAQLAISAGGGTIAELELYKVPTILVTTADNQIGAASKTWCHVIQSSLQKKILMDEITRSALELWNDKAIRDQMLSKLNDKLDRFGATRIAQEILKLRINR